MIQIYWDKKDIHTETAMEAFGLPEDRIDPLAHRAPAKNVNFAIAFGETHKGLFDQLVSDSYGKSGIPVPDWLTLDWCKGFIERWFGIYEEVLPYMETQYYRARRYGCTWDMFGRIRAIPEVESVHKKTIAEGLRYAGNMPIQAPDSGVMRLAMSEVRDEICVPLLKDGIWCRPLLTIHDEIILETDEEVAEMVQWEGERIMGNVLRDRETGESHVRVPIVAQGKVMDRWSK
jgi:DNA polymerase-1